MHWTELLQKVTVFVAKAGLHPAKCFATKCSSFLELTAHLLQQTLSLLTNKSCFSQYFQGAGRFLIHSLHVHKHTVHVVGLINKENLLCFPSDHFHQGMTHSQVQSVEAFT